MTVLSFIGIYLVIALPLAVLVGRRLKYCATFLSDAETEIAAAKAWSEVHEDSFPINSGM